MSSVASAAQSARSLPLRSMTARSRILRDEYTFDRRWQGYGQSRHFGGAQKTLDDAYVSPGYSVGDGNNVSGVQAAGVSDDGFTVAGTGSASQTSNVN